MHKTFILVVVLAALLPAVSMLNAQEVTIGVGDQDVLVPLNYYYRNNLFQSMYYADEIGSPSTIHSLALYSQFQTILEDMPVKIWMYNTDLDDLGGGWITADQMTLVFDGTVTFPIGESEIVFPLQTPFPYRGKNLVIMYKRPPISFYIGSNMCRFKGQTIGSTRARHAYSDTVNDDPYAPLNSGTLSGQFPKTTLVLTPLPVGSISGTVTDANNQPFSGATVCLSDNIHHTTTNTAGQYSLTNIVADTYTISFNVHGYFEHTQSFTLAADANLTLNATLQPLPQVSVTGTVLTSSTGVAPPNARIQLGGYQGYLSPVDAAGNFTIEGVHSGHTYTYNIGAWGYASVNGQISVGTTDIDMGTFTLDEALYKPEYVYAEANEQVYAMDVHWLEPNPSAIYIATSFEEETFPPPGWTQITTNNGPANLHGVYPTWCKLGPLNNDPPYLRYQAGLRVDNQHQDEWLITPSFICPPEAFIGFHSRVYLGSLQGDHYYVKISTDDGATWTVLWDASGQTGGWNEYNTPFAIDLGDYYGNEIKIAFHALGSGQDHGLSYGWFITDICVSDLTVSAGLGFADQPPKVSRALTGYLIYRLEAGQEEDESTWVSVTDEPTTGLSITDFAWYDLPNGDYRWAVKAVYTGGLTSAATLSRIYTKSVQSGTLAGTVKDRYDNPIAGAIVTNGIRDTTTNAEGAYSLTLPAGYHYQIAAYAPGFDTTSHHQVLINPDETTTLNFILCELPNDDPQVPVVATALNGNHPNPFNPETTISYSVKEPGMVRIQIYNIKGQLVCTLVDEAHAAGQYKQIFDARDDRGRNISNGVYLIRMQAPGYHKTSKMILMQ
jgi:hypothetical protein